MKKKTLVLATIMAMVVATTTYVYAGTKGISYPNYRTWNHAKSMVINDTTNPLAGFHHVYVNDKALKNHKKGGKYAQGASFAVPFYEVVEKDGVITQGKKVMTAVMVKDKNATTTGGWYYQAFDPKGKKIEMDVKTGCFDCHTQAKASDYVFSKYID